MRYAIEKTRLAVFLAVCLLGGSPRSAEAGDGEVLGVIAGGALAGAGFLATLASLEQQLEHFAVERMLEVRPDLTDFTLYVADLDASSLWDLSTVTAVPCVVAPEGGEPFVFMMLFDDGWVSDVGLDMTKVSYRMISRTAWNRTMVSMVRVAGVERVADGGKIPVYDKKTARLVRTYPSDVEGPKAHASGELLRRVSGWNAYFEVGEECLVAPLVRLEDNQYRVSAINELDKLVYSQRSVQLFLSDFGRLMRLSMGSIERIHSDLFPEDGACNHDVSD